MDTVAGLGWRNRRFPLKRATPAGGSAKLTSRSRPAARMRPTPLVFARRNHWGPCGPGCLARETGPETTPAVYGASENGGYLSVTRTNA
jgi:hypothetical protein